MNRPLRQCKLDTRFTAKVSAPTQFDPLKPQPAVFFDRDGTLIEDTGFLRRPDDVRFLEGAIEGLKLLRDNGFRLIVVSNQSGIARGIIEPEQLIEVHERFCQLLSREGVDLTDCLYCPHHTQGTIEPYRKDCADRKGSPGMIFKAAWRHGIFLPRSWMIGDRDDDVRAGNRAGVKTIRIQNPDHPPTGTVQPDFNVDHLLQAAGIIVQSPPRREET